MKVIGKGNDFFIYHREQKVLQILKSLVEFQKVYILT
jgi:hypothetical protein